MMNNFIDSNQNFNDNTVVPHPYDENKQLTLKDLKYIQNELHTKLNLKYTILASDVRYVAGVDIGYHKSDETRGNVVISIYDFKTMKEVYRTQEYVKLSFPYISGFLGFREVTHFRYLLEKVKNVVPEFYPDIVMVDGNGLLHYYGFGSACHLGVELNIPTIGIGKKLYCIDGLDAKNYKNTTKKCGEFIDLTGKTGKIWGRAIWNSQNASNCIFVSQGNYISLDEASKIILRTSSYRIPEPIRQADLMSKQFPD
jgi:deoxyinosine 3'endonuclease (endonuclease V)